MSQNDSNASESDPTLALILAGVGVFIPLLAGAGQIYNGDTAKGVLITVVQLINIVMTLTVLLAVIFGPLYLIVAAYAGYDAYTTAQP